jgi:hypothetical protein
MTPLSDKEQAALFQRIADHEAKRLAEEQAEVERLQALNEAARQKHQAQVEAEKASLQEKHELELNEALAPYKATAMRRWLTDHPDQSEASFEQLAWPHLKVNILEELENEKMAEYEKHVRETRPFIV